MDWYNEEKEPNILNYLALAYTIIGGSDVVPDIAILRNNQEAKERVKEIKKIRAEGGKTELETKFAKWKKENKRKHKVYLYDIELNKEYIFESKSDAIKKLNLKIETLNKLKGPKLIEDKYIVSAKKIKIKQIKAKDYIYILETGYPKGLFYIETLTNNYLSIDSRRSSTEIKKHDCKEAAIEYLLNLEKR